MPLIDEGKPIRTVLRWQLYATAASMSIAAPITGFHGALSALLGGLVNVVAGAVFGWVATRSTRKTAGEATLAVLRAEALKIVLIVAQLWMVLAFYEEIVLGAFFGTFILTVLISTIAIAARNR